MRPVTCLCGTALLSLVTSVCGPRGDARANPESRTLVGVAAVVTASLPHDVRNGGGLATIGIATLFALSARGALLKPAFLVMVAVRFHALIEHQEINQEWVARLEQLSTDFRALGARAHDYLARAAVPPSTAPAPTSPLTA